MISVVICSVNAILAEQVKSNIDNTIGVPWEPVIIDNSNPSRGITAVYNEGVRRASFHIICFVHEDVAFLTNGWGKLLIGYFNADDTLGMVGVAGAGYKSRTLSGWMTSIEQFDRFNITHRDSKGKNEKMFFDQPPPARLKEVVTLDGVLLCTKKEIIEQIPFDEQFLKGFHLYDVDISFRLSRAYKVVVSFEIDLLHYTEGGDFGDNWVESTLEWHQRYNDRLPVSTGDLKREDQGKAEYKVCFFWLTRLRKENISARNRFTWVLASGAWRRISLWPHILLFLLKTKIS